MKFKQGILAQKVLPFLMVMLLLSPVWVSLAHEISEHEHPICDSISTHYHEQPVDCDLCDFSLASFDFECLQFEIDSIALSSWTKSEFRPTLFGKSSNELKRGRAPPVMQF